MKKTNTIEQAKEYLKENWVKGTSCPCCNQFVKVYPWKITTGSAVVLIKMYRFKEEWIHPLKDLKVNNGDYAKLRHWALIEKKEHDPFKTTTKNSGYWRLTDKGRSFVLNRSKIQQYAKLYNSKCWGYEGKVIDIHDALGTKFNYWDLMNE